MSQCFISSYEPNISPVFHLKNSFHTHLGPNSAPSIHVELSSPSVPLFVFSLPSAADISLIIRQSMSSTCQLDHIPTVLVKSCLFSLLPIITNIIPSSLTSGTVPTSFKSAAIAPIICKPSLNLTNLFNIYPISNLPFISKIIKKVVAT